MEKLINKLIISIGSVASLIIHTILFILAWLFTDFLFLTTVVSLEAIYLSILIQLSVNIQAKKLQSIQEDVEGIQEDVGEIQEDVEEINEEDEDEDEDDESLKEIKLTMNEVQKTLGKLMKEVIELKKKTK
jgi:peptidoglycan hydrolase CwlO-like protein